MQLSDWYGITRKQVKEKGGRCLFFQHTSLADLLKACYPDFVWQQSKFREEGSTPHGYWDNAKVKREWLDKIGPQLGIKEVVSCNSHSLALIRMKWTDWYSVLRKDVEGRGAKGMFRKATLRQVVQAAYPEHPWEESRFIEMTKSPAGYWQQKDNLFNAIDKAEAALGIQQVCPVTQ